MGRSGLALVWVAGLLAYTAFRAVGYRDRRHDIRPYEPGHIAQALASGHGFSYPASTQWFFVAPPGDTTSYRPTAWQEPVWPLIMAAADRVFSDPGRARDALILLRGLCLIATAFALLGLGRSLFGVTLGTGAGLLAGTVLVLLRDVQEGLFTSIKSQYLLGLQVVVACLLLIEIRRRPGPLRGAGLGAFLGLAALTGSATVLMGPLAAGTLARARATALALLLGWAAVILPWSLRNYHVFGELVPIRTGFGLIFMSGNPILAQTLDPAVGGCPGIPQPVFRASTAWEAVQLALEPRNAKRLDSRPVKCAALELGSRYFGMNEAQRDRYWSDQASRFVRAYPGVAIRLAVAKLGTFFLRTGKAGAVVTFAAIAGLVLSASAPMTGAVLLLAVSQAAPYVASVPYFYRYRYPLDPVLLLFGAYAVVALTARLLGPRPADGQPGRVAA
jgi:hypothetical protein